MNKKKIISALIAGTMAITSIAGTAFAATNNQAIIDDSRTGTINIHKLIENDGLNEAAYGLVNKDEDRIPVNNIGFDYLKLATIQNMRGIVISDDNGINWEAQNGEVSVGAYYVGNDTLDELIGLIGYTPTPTFIKTDIVGDSKVAPNLQYEWNDQRSNTTKEKDGEEYVNVTKVDEATGEIIISTRTDLAVEQQAVTDAAAKLSAAANERNSAYKAMSSSTTSAKNNGLEYQKAVAALLEAKSNYKQMGEDLKDAQNKLGEETDTASTANDATAWAKFKATKEALDAAKKALGKETDTASTADDASAYAKFKAAEDKYKNSDTSTLAQLKAAEAALLEAQNKVAEAESILKQKEEALKQATANLASADAAQKAAREILETAQEAINGSGENTSADPYFDGADVGRQDSITGTQNALIQAVAQLEEAKSQLKDAQENVANATSAFDTAQGNKDKAETTLGKETDTASTADDASAYAKLEAAKDALKTAYGEFSDELQALNNAKDAVAQAQDAWDAADQALANAKAKADSAQTSAKNAEEKQTKAQDEVNRLADILANEYDPEAETLPNPWTGETEQSQTDVTEYNRKNEVYLQARNTYDNAVKALKDKAASLGVQKVYTAQSLQDMMQHALATLSEDTINSWVKEKAASEGNQTRYTSDKGVATFSGLDLGLYLVAETDYTYHDGFAGAYNDGIAGTPIYDEDTGAISYGELTNSINNDELNYYDKTGYHIFPVDGQGQYTEHVYPKGAVYKEAINPEFPVIDTPSAPFLVSVPTTNSKTTTVKDVAAGDQYGEAGTVWQYTVDVYPKNQTTAIFKRIIDPDETTGSEILRTSEDYQIGDKISQIIWAEAPRLQPNYLDSDNADAANKHLGYVIADNMTEGLTFDKVTKVTVIPASQIKGQNLDEVGYIYFNPDGGRVSAEEALVDPSNPATSATKTITKYYDADRHEVTEDVFNSASELNIGSYTKEELKYKKYIASGVNYTAADTHFVSDFDLQANASSDDGITLVGEGENPDYIVVDIAQAGVTLTDNQGTASTVIQQGEYNGFAVVLTEAGLAKLDNRTSGSIVCVYFDSILNKDAAIGETPENMNYATLHWVNTNTSFKKISSNEVYDYTYELVIKKEGVQDPTQVKFIVKRTDTNDFRQAADKDLTDVVSQQAAALGQDDSMKFVEEAPGIYHVWGYLGDKADTSDAFETTEVNGTVYNTVTPGPDGTLKIKGLDSNTYSFKEIATEAGKNLLKDPFHVVLIADDCTEANPYDSLRDGRLLSATVSTGRLGDNNTEPIDITIGANGTTGSDYMGDYKNLGIASMAVNNYNIIDLRTGGAGRTMIYIIGAALLGAMGVGAIVLGKKKKVEE